MPLINNIEVVDRHNRPSVESRVMLRTYFINDGVYQDPHAVSSVHVFAKSQNLSPSTVLDSDQLISTETDTAKMVFKASGEGVVSGNIFSPTNYTGVVRGAGVAGASPCSGVSGIYKLSTGTFAVVLDGLLGSALSGVSHSSTSIMNGASGAASYIDVWTVKMTEGGAWRTYINTFELFDDTFISITEPVLLRAKNRLFNKNIYLGSKVGLKIGTDITIENENIDEATRNIFKEAAITNAYIEIHKLNEDSNLPARVPVVKSNNVNITSENTIIYTLDTDNIFDGGGGSVDDLGSRRGTYMLRVSYNLLTEKIFSSPLYFVIK